MNWNPRHSAEACWLAQFSTKPCDGRLIKAHLIAQQTIKKQYPHGAWLYPDGTTDKVLFSQRDKLRPGEYSALDAIWIKQDELLWDPRIWVAACGGPTGCSGHHGALDTTRSLRIPRVLLPSGVEQFAEQFDLTWWIERNYG